MSNPTPWLRAAAAVGSLFLATSCYYDGYAGGGYGGGGGGYAYESYGSGYGYGYGGGYSSGGISTTFVYTSSDRWFYDPAVYCYYDRYRRCYYDPYLVGYYPVGYCPRPVYGVPHPGGWRPGMRYCPPPSGFRDRRLSSYDNRADLLRHRNFSWSGSVREQQVSNDWRNQRIRSADSFRDRRDNDPGRGPGSGGPGRPGGNNSWNQGPDRNQGPWNGGGNWNGNPGGNNNRPGGNSSGRPGWGNPDLRRDDNRFPQQGGGGGGGGSFPQRGGNSSSNSGRPQFQPQPQRPGYNQPVDLRPRGDDEGPRRNFSRQPQQQQFPQGRPQPQFQPQPQPSRPQPQQQFQPRPQPQQQFQPRPQPSQGGGGGGAPRSSRPSKDDGGGQGGFRRGH